MLLLVLQFLQLSDGRLYHDSRSGVVGPGTTSYHFHAGTTVPDACSSSLHLGFATEGASVLGVLTDFNFLHHFPEGSTITGPVFAHDSDLLGAFGLLKKKKVREKPSNKGSDPPHTILPPTQPPPAPRSPITSW